MNNNITTIEQLPKGEYFRIGKQKKIYENDGYCRTNKKYECTDVEDHARQRYLKKGTVVTIAEY